MNIAKMDVKDLKNIQIGGNKKQKKPTHIPTKKGINLASHEDEQQRKKTAVIFLLIALVLLAVLAKFGVIDQYAKLRVAENSYNETHVKYLQTAEELEDYDEVLLEYRTYSMDWLENDDDNRYVSVSRRKILDVVQQKIMTKGTVIGLSISGDTLSVQMQGMNLQQISAMCADLEKTDFIESAILQTASTNSSSTTTEGGVVTNNGLSFNIEIRLQSENEEG